MDGLELIGVVSGLIAIGAALVSAVKYGVPVLKRHPGLARVYLKVFKPKDTKYETLWRRVVAELNPVGDGLLTLHGFLTNGMPYPERDENRSDAVLGWMNDASCNSRAAKIRAEPTLVNRSHGLLIGQPSDVRTAPLRYVRTDYAMIKAAREAALRPAILSAGAIVFCPAHRTILLQSRSRSVEQYPGCWHLLGGNYEPATDLHDCDDGADDPLLRAAVREVFEESHLRLNETGDPLISFAEEHATGFVQFFLAGVAVSPAQMGGVQGSREGGVEAMSLDRIVDQFNNPKVAERRWVPSCALHLAAWLGLGAPDQHQRTPMRKEALAAYRAILPKLREGFAAVDGGPLATEGAPYTA
ncbi:NUDIX hydrolase [Phenylobacterium sp.]|uniref:NUDIX hydrolase n=1 Tax=Phenylobacterium sp. TaxID=1871053 RepID=UPI002FCA04EA